MRKWGITPALRPTSMYQTISTMEIPAHQRLDFWRDVSSQIFVPLDCHEASSCGSTSFQAEVRHTSLGEMDLMCLTASAHAVARTGSHLACDSESCFLVSVLNRGTGYLIQDDRKSEQSCGDIVLYDTTRPYEMGFHDEFSKYVLKIPRHLLSGYVPRPERLCSQSIGSGSGVRVILKGLLDTLSQDTYSELTQIERDATARAVIELISGSLNQLSDSLPSDPGKLKAYHLARIKSYVKENISDPELSCELIARALRMSVSSLYRAYEGEAVPLAQWIWRTRLESCANDLRNPALKNVSASEIAYSRGYSNFSHFSRTFKKSMNLSPSEYRKLHVGFH